MCALPACCSSFCRQALGLFCSIIVVRFYNSIHFYPCEYLTLAPLVHGPHMVWECVCLCVCVHMYVCVCVHVCVCVCICVCVDRMILKYALCWHIHKSVHPVLCQCRHAHTHAHAHTCMHACTHAQTHARTNTYTHTYACMHARTHTHTHTHIPYSLIVSLQPV